MPSDPADEYTVQVRMNGGPFKIENDHKSVVRKSDLTGRVGMILSTAN